MKYTDKMEWNSTNLSGTVKERLKNENNGIQRISKTSHAIN